MHAERFLDYYKMCRKLGMNEAEIAKSLGMSVVGFRLIRHDCMLLKREQNKKEEEA